MLRGTVGEPARLERREAVATWSRPAGRDHVKAPCQLAGGSLVIDSPAPEVRPGLISRALYREPRCRHPLPALQEFLPGQHDRVVGSRILIDRYPQRAGQLPQAREAHLYAQP